ncbi:MAG: tryptophan--tRNA ligase [Patescibacteria group bacterium]|nr:tryptophan--tRNA ligase [Patescibacteria group bacterium]
MKPVLVSGIQPSGRLHIGNYLGALKNFVDLQNSGKYECHFFIADLHSLTESFEPEEKRGQILNLAADFLAAGIDPEKSVIFQQSRIPAHSELAWILNTITPMGELARMTQFKEKSEKFNEKYIEDLNLRIKSGQPLSTEEALNSVFVRLSVANVGLFDYPVLMAADILLYDAAVVPVGDDQLQHLELTRTLARKFNKKFGKTFIEPKDLLTKTPRVMSLKDPAKKMSKSQPESCLFIDDSPEEIRQKIARATTDSGSGVKYDPEEKPGLSNLLEIYAALGGKEPKAVAKEFAGKNYSAFKAALSELVADYFADFRKKKKELLASGSELATVLKAGSERANMAAEKKIAEIRMKIGISLNNH